MIKRSMYGVRGRPTALLIRVKALENENERLRTTISNLDKSPKLAVDLLRDIMRPQHTVEDDKIVSRAIDKAAEYLKTNP